MNKIPLIDEPVYAATARVTSVPTPEPLSNLIPNLPTLTVQHNGQTSPVQHDRQPISERYNEWKASRYSPSSSRFYSVVDTRALDARGESLNNLSDKTEGLNATAHTFKNAAIKFRQQRETAAASSNKEESFFGKLFEI